MHNLVIQFLCIVQCGVVIPWHFNIHYGTKIHIPLSFFILKVIYTPALIISEKQNLLCVLYHLQGHARSALEVFTELLRPARPWEKCTMTAASPAVSVVRLQLMYQFRCMEILHRADDMRIYTQNTSVHHGTVQFLFYKNK